MQVLLIGNMNNSSFAMLRYLIDMNFGAYLLYFKDDNKGNMTHFDWKKDTFYHDRYVSFIEELPFNSGYESCLLGERFINIFKESKLINWLNTLYNESQIVIGTGSAPALCHALNWDLDIFKSHSGGIEYLGTPTILNQSRPRLSYRWIKPYILRTYQKLGLIKNTKTVILTDFASNKETLTKYRSDFHISLYPDYYKEITTGLIKLNINLHFNGFEESNINIISTCSQFWLKPQLYNYKQFHKQNKRNHWTLKAIYLLKKKYPTKPFMFWLLDSGKDVDKTKVLVRQYGLDKCVRFFKPIDRRYLSVYLSNFFAFIGEFTLEKNKVWGVSFMEAILNGVPALQHVGFESSEFKREFDHELPPHINVSNANDIVSGISSLIENPAYSRKLSKDALRWSKENYGSNIMRRWLDIVKRKQESGGGGRN